MGALASAPTKGNQDQEIDGGILHLPLNLGIDRALD
jgi:hypothetical protein